jgi:hypothetical protein
LKDWKVKKIIFKSGTASPIRSSGRLGFIFSGFNSRDGIIQGYLTYTIFHAPLYSHLTHRLLGNFTDFPLLWNVTDFTLWLFYREGYSFAFLF